MPPIQRGIVHTDNFSERSLRKFEYLNKPDSFLPGLVRAKDTLPAIRTSFLHQNCGISPELLQGVPSLPIAAGLSGHQKLFACMFLSGKQKRFNYIQVQQLARLFEFLPNLKHISTSRDLIRNWPYKERYQQIFIYQT